MLYDCAHMAAAHRKSKGFTPEAWEARRSFIKRTYLQEGKSVEVLLKELASRGFHVKCVSPVCTPESSKINSVLQPEHGSKTS